MQGPFAILDSITLATAEKVGVCMMELTNETQRGQYLVEMLRGLLALGCQGRTDSGASKGFYIWQDGSVVGVNPQVCSPPGTS